MRNLNPKNENTLYPSLYSTFLCSAQGTEEVPYIRHDSFAFNAFGFQPTVKNFQENYRGKLVVTKKPIKNVHDKTVVDTVFTLSVGKTKIEIYRAKHLDILQSAIINTDRLPLKYNIRIGDSKADVAKRLNALVTADKVKVGDLNRERVYTLTFLNGKLSLISYEGYIN